MKKDYVIENQIDCDPYADACFIWECDPESTVEGEACTGDPEADIWYYQIARRSAANIPLCDPETDETCDPWTCAEGEKDCEAILCDETTKVDQGVECSDHVQYAIDNPIEEEAVECEEGDEECLAALEETACEEGDEECLAAEEEAVECEEGDTECLSAKEEDEAAAAEEEAVECDPETEDCAVNAADENGSEEAVTENPDAAGTEDATTDDEKVL